MLAVAVLTVVATAVAYAFLTSPSAAPRDVPPHVVASLGNGSLWTDLPLWAWYTPTALSLKGFTSGMDLTTFTYHQGPYAHIRFGWTDATGTAEEIRFHLVAPVDPWGTGASIASGVNGSFEYLPAGGCGDGCISTGVYESSSGPDGIQTIEFLNVRIAYTAVRMAETNNSVDRSWLQVNYTVEPFGTYAGMNLPVANVTAPAPGDLIPASGPMAFNFTRKQAWSVHASVHDFVQPAGGFHHALPRMSFLPGSSSAFSARLVSEFAWDAASDSTVWLGADQGMAFTMLWFFDMRFGTLVSQYG